VSLSRTFISTGAHCLVGRRGWSRRRQGPGCVLELAGDRSRSARERLATNLCFPHCPDSCRKASRAALTSAPGANVAQQAQSLATNSNDLPRCACARRVASKRSLWRQQFDFLANSGRFRSFAYPSLSRGCSRALVPGLHQLGDGFTREHVDLEFAAAQLFPKMLAQRLLGRGFPRMTAVGEPASILLQM
jgi:hypothetical protein